MSNRTIDATVRELVVERPGRARVFEQLGIDYCCGGSKPLAAACRESGLDVEKVLGELSAADQQTQDETDWTKATMTELADHIEATHHAYLRSELPRLEQLLAKMANRHGESHPELTDLWRVFERMREELMSHMMKEEQILFPMIRQLEQNGPGQGQFHCGSVQNPIRVMIMEHDAAGDALKKMRELTDDYQLPADVCTSYQALLDGVAELERDLHQHIHKENNILFPKAIEAEGR